MKTRIEETTLVNQKKKMNACEKELAAARAYNRFMDRRVAQLEAQVRALLKEKASGAWGDRNSVGAEDNQSNNGTQSGGGAVHRAVSVSSNGPGAIKPSSSSPSVQQAYLSAQRQRGNSVMSQDNTGGAVVGDLAEGLAGLGSGMNVVEELIRLRGENDLLKQHYRDRVGDINALKSEVEEGSQREARLLTVNEQLRFEIDQLKDALPFRLFAERPHDDRKVREILAQTAKLRKEIDDATISSESATASSKIATTTTTGVGKDLDKDKSKSSFVKVAKLFHSAVQVTHFLQAETTSKRSKMKQLAASNTDDSSNSDPNSLANIDVSDPNWRFENILYFASYDEGEERALGLLSEVERILEAVKTSAKAIDETISTYNVVARHAVAIIVQGQSCTTVAECLETKRAASEFIQTMNGIRAQRKEGVVTTRDMLPSIATRLRQVSNALLGSMTRRITRTARPLITQLELLAIRCQNFDTTAFANSEAVSISVGAVEQVLKLIVETDAEATGFERIEVSDIRALSNEFVRSQGDLSTEFISLADHCIMLLSQTKTIITGKAENELDAAANETHASKGCQCNLSNPKLELSETERQYEKLLKSFLDARAIERQAEEEIRAQARQSRAFLLKEEAGAQPAWASGVSSNSFRNVGGSSSPLRNGGNSPMVAFRNTRGQSPSIIVKEKADQIAAKRLQDRNNNGSSACPMRGESHTIGPNDLERFDPTATLTGGGLPPGTNTPSNHSQQTTSASVRRALAAAAAATPSSTHYSSATVSRGMTPFTPEYDPHGAALADILGTNPSSHGGGVGGAKGVGFRS